MMTGKMWGPSARQGHTIDDRGSRVAMDLGKELGCGDGAERGRVEKNNPQAPSLRSRLGCNLCN